MYPHERSLVTRFDKKPFVIIGVNSDKDRAAILAKAGQLGLTWRSFWDGGSTQGPIAGTWNVQGWPTVYLIDHLLVIRGKGHQEVANEAKIAELVAAAETANHQ